MRYRKKPVVIEARPFDVDWALEIAAWCGGTLVETLDTPAEIVALNIPTLEGVMQALPGDWIIQGVKGEFYPCKPDIFEQTYEPVLTDNP